MGWLSINNQSDAPTVPSIQIHTSNDIESESYNDAPEKTPTNIQTVKAACQHRPFQDLSSPDKNLPFIDPREVKATEQGRSMGLPDWRLWIVIDDVVYDCTDFQHEHPGGRTIIQKFAGQSCGWQFWRFHSKSHMEEYGRKLRVGRTSEVGNPYKEPARYVGLRKLGDDWFDS